jgi:hypothetical protein
MPSRAGCSYPDSKETSLANTARLCLDAAGKPRGPTTVPVKNPKTAAGFKEYSIRKPQIQNK